MLVDEALSERLVVFVACPVPGLAGLSASARRVARGTGVLGTIARAGLARVNPLLTIK